MRNKVHILSNGFILFDSLGEVVGKSLNCLDKTQKKNAIARYQAIVIGSWTLIGYMCHAERTVEMSTGDSVL